MISIKIFRDLLHFAYCIAAQVYQGFIAVVVTLFPCIVYQLKFETDCIAAAVVVSLCVPRDHNYLELLMRWSMFVSTNRPEHANPFILIAGKDFGTQNGTQEFKNMLLLFILIGGQDFEPKMPSKKYKVNRKFGCKIGIQEQQMQQPKTQDFGIGVRDLHKGLPRLSHCKSSGLSLLEQY
jgi:hypothetical protein